MALGSEPRSEHRVMSGTCLSMNAYKIPEKINNNDKGRYKNQLRGKNIGTIPHQKGS